MLHTLSYPLVRKECWHLQLKLQAHFPCISFCLAYCISAYTFRMGTAWFADWSNALFAPFPFLLCLACLSICIWSGLLLCSWVLIFYAIWQPLGPIFTGIKTFLGVKIATCPVSHIFRILEGVSSSLSSTQSIFHSEQGAWVHFTDEGMETPDEEVKCLSTPWPLPANCLGHPAAAAVGIRAASNWCHRLGRRLKLSSRTF
jgi:hypothetical protein